MIEPKEQHNHGIAPTVYWIDERSIAEALHVAHPKRWECPCECGAYALYGWRKVGDDGALELEKVVVRRHGKDVTVDPDPEQMVLWMVMSQTFYDDKTIRLMGIESVDEIGTSESIAFYPPLDRNLAEIWLAVGLADALRKEMST